MSVKDKAADDMILVLIDAISPGDYHGTNSSLFSKVDSRGSAKYQLNYPHLAHYRHPSIHPSLHPMALQPKSGLGLPFLRFLNRII
jgi:hypothetical protein